VGIVNSNSTVNSTGPKLSGSIDTVIRKCNSFDQHFENQRNKVPFYPILPAFRKNIAFGNVPGLRPFVLLICATYECVALVE
jgi:hypothetical protein